MLWAVVLSKCDKSRDAKVDKVGWARDGISGIVKQRGFGNVEFGNANREYGRKMQMRRY